MQTFTFVDFKVVFFNQTKSLLLMSTSAKALNSSQRLQFIDMARSLAIILMLEGHFTGAALDPSFRDSEFTLYKIWTIIHGFTKPLFFVVTGVIFSYLLFAHKGLSFRENPRVRSGFRRIFQLLFWGYLIQVNLRGLFKSFIHDTSYHLQWLAAFHVLQSLAIGIFFILLVYGIFSLVKKGNILVYYIIATIIALYFQGELLAYIRFDQNAILEGCQKVPQYWPNNAPAVIQNMFYGNYSDFTFVTSTPLILMGAIFGIVIRKYENQIRQLKFALLLIFLGLLMKIFAYNCSWFVDMILEQIGNHPVTHFRFAHYSVTRFGEVTAIIGLLILVEKYGKFNKTLFLKLGQNTFALYVIHVIILYGGIFGIGLKPNIINQNLNPYLSIMVSILAILSFTLFVQYIDRFERLYYGILRKIGLK